MQFTLSDNTNLWFFLKFLKQKLSMILKIIIIKDNINIKEFVRKINYYKKKNILIHWNIILF